MGQRTVLSRQVATALNTFVRDFVVRQAVGEDAGPLAALIHRAFEDYRGRLIPPSGAHAETSASLVAAMGKGAAFLAEAQGGLIACIFAELRSDRIYLGRLAVDPAHRRAGLGAVMLAEAERYARRQGVGRLKLGVRLVLSDNIVLFQKVGFEIVGQRSHPGFSVPTYHVMEKQLP